ncbi:hypothetical protein ACLOJK_027809 [Asimina triloba]
MCPQKLPLADACIVILQWVSFGEDGSSSANGGEDAAAVVRNDDDEVACDCDRSGPNASSPPSCLAWISRRAAASDGFVIDDGDVVCDCLDGEGDVGRRWDSSDQRELVIVVDLWGSNHRIELRPEVHRVAVPNEGGGAPF